ncbi:hypothetical protein NQ317_007909 [Molorchus minor]|uniref:Uncharacterized protein n=1 Tax=Molorchus minor TaxID=1323400 RepID=A0ABQ9JTC7_9CUCU|nr:hypothetical protein NQ317_007909 [Molorchus minor]
MNMYFMATEIKNCVDFYNISESALNPILKTENDTAVMRIETESELIKECIKNGNDADNLAEIQQLTVKVEPWIYEDRISFEETLLPVIQSIGNQLHVIL